MSADTPECAKLNHLKNKFLGEHAPNPLAMYCKTSNSLKNDPFTFKYRFTPTNVCRQSNHHKCFADKVRYTFNVLLLA